MPAVRFAATPPDRPPLAAIRFGAENAMVAMPVLPDGGTLWEIWEGGATRLARDEPDERVATDGDATFGVLAMPGDGDPERATQALHARMLALLEGGPTPHLLRLWNYVPRITAPWRGVERYRLFNEGRRHVMLGRDGLPPAASALGSFGEGQILAFLADRAPGLPIENPRQVSAYAYPSQYGPSPLFSRALLHGGILYISGTASIVGHRSLHPGDPTAQTDETIRNLRALLDEAARHGFSMTRLEAKAYVRRAEDRTGVMARLGAAFPPPSRVVCLRADICREELLVEVEATAFGPRDGGGAPPPVRRAYSPSS